MDYMSTPTHKKTWQPRRRRVSVLAEMALRKERIAERLADLRGMKGFSQEQAAGFVGITVRQWQRWEAGESVPYPRNLDQIASRFGISVAEFFEEPAAAETDGAGQLDRIEEAITQLLERQDQLADGLAAALEQLKALQERSARRKAA